MQIRKQTGSDTYVVLDDTTIYEVDMSCRRELERLRKMQGNKKPDVKKTDEKKTPERKFYRERD